MIMRIIYIAFTIPGILLIIFTGIANRLTSGTEDNGALRLFTDYILKSGIKGLDFEVGLILILHKTNEYSLWLITIGIIWITIFLFLTVNNGRRKIGKEKD